MVNKKILIYSLITILSFIYVKYRNNTFENSLNNFANNKQAIYIGEILEYNKQTDYLHMYTFRIKDIDNMKVNMLIHLYTKKQYDYGDILALNMELELPVGSRNPGGFNNKRYLFSKGIYATGYLTNEISIHKQDSGFLGSINKYKEKVTNKILNKYDERCSSILISLLLGDNKYLTNQTKQIFSNSSLSHILSVSGTHLAFMITVISYLLYKLNIKFKLKNIILIFFVIFYLILTGFRVSIIRAGIMYIISCVCILKNSSINKKINKLTIVLIILLMLLIYNPFNIFNTSLILSFSAVFGIMLFSKSINYKLQYNLNKKNKTKYRKIINIFSITITVQIVLIPIISIFFNKINLLSVFSNIICVPISNICLFLGTIFSIIPDIPAISNIIVFLNTIIINLLIVIADYFSKLPLSYITVFPFRWYEVLIYYLSIYMLFVSGKTRYIITSIFLIIYYYVKNIWNNILYRKTRILIVIYILITIFLLTHISKSKLVINFIDVGQGDSTLIRCYGKTILIDGGGSKSDSFDVGEKILLPYLLHERISKIDYVIISHFDSDHIMGLIPVLNNINVGRVICGQSTEKTEEYYHFIENIRGRGSNIYEVTEYDRIQICKNVFIDILAPIQNVDISESISNNSSLVCKLTYLNTKILFTGDIEKQTENILINKDISADILKVGHHGSKTSTTQNFLNKVNPKISVICVGKNNFGHPANEVLKRLEEKKSDIYRTDLHGIVTINIDLNEKIKINKMINKVSE